MRRTIAVLALPATMLALAGVVFGSFDPAPAGTAVSSEVASAARPTDIRRVETGAAVAVTQTNWQETGDGSAIVPTNPPTGHKR